jgi:hypothetical protein
MDHFFLSLAAFVASGSRGNIARRKSISDRY